MDIHHHRRVQVERPAHTVHRINNCVILHNDGIGMDARCEQFQQTGQRFQISPAHQLVDRNIKAFSMLMRESTGFYQLVIGEVVVLAMQAHVEQFAAAVEGIGAGIQEAEENLESPGRCQQLEIDPGRSSMSGHCSISPWNRQCIRAEALRGRIIAENRNIGKNVSCSSHVFSCAEAGWKRHLRHPRCLSTIACMIDLKFAPDPALQKVRIGALVLTTIDWNRAEQVVPPALREQICAAARDPAPFDRQQRIRIIRDMLRNGKYKPAGRAKPSPEYLLQSALEQDFPSVNPLVDAVNLASLESLYPMSIFDLEKAGAKLLLRRGRTGESYVFNPSGQTIDLEDLLCVCSLKENEADGRPIVNPVRDSMATKLFPGASHAVVVVYAPHGPEGRDLEAVLARMATWYACAVDTIEQAVFEPDATS